jgi:HEAT repeat protein
VPLFVLGCQDPCADVRQFAARCLDELGPSGASAVSAIQNLCADTNVLVQVQAARALWDISHETNTAAPVLYGILTKTTDAASRFWVAYYLSEMKVSDSVVVETFISSLTNTSLFIGTSACESLGRLGPAATAATPALLNARDSSNSLLSAYATRALEQIHPKRADDLQRQ